jgi:hypothetical protein
MLLGNKRCGDSRIELLPRLGSNFRSDGVWP